MCSILKGLTHVSPGSGPSFRCGRTLALHSRAQRRPVLSCAPVGIGMSYLEAALIVLALGAALPAVAHTLLEARRSLHRPRHWLTM